jgi:hypothetical protein
VIQSSINIDDSEHNKEIDRELIEQRDSDSKNEFVSVFGHIAEHEQYYLKKLESKSVLTADFDTHVQLLLVFVQALLKSCDSTILSEQSDSIEFNEAERILRVLISIAPRKTAPGKNNSGGIIFH